MCKYYLQEILLGGEFLCPLGRNLNRGMTRTSWPFRASSLAAVWMEWREEQLIISEETIQEGLVLLQERDNESCRKPWQWVLGVEHGLEKQWTDRIS